MEVTFWGIVIDCNDLQSLNVCFSIVSMFSGSVISVIGLPAKQYEPIYSSELGSVTDVSPVL